MSLLDADLGASRSWTRVGDWYEVTRKPRSLDLTRFPAIPFAPMEAIPQGGAYAPAFTMRAPSAISSGTYFERGDLLISKITPSFENGKQALIYDLPLPFGYATTEVIPLRPRNRDHDPRLLFFYLLHPDVRHHVAERMEGSTGRQRVPESVLLDLPFPLLEPSDQRSIADSLEVLQHASSAELGAQRASHDLKRTAMQALFTRGLRGGAQKETEIGLVPEGWGVVSIEECSEAISKGASPKWQGFSYVDEGILFVRSQNVGEGVMRWEDRAYLPASWNEKEKRSILRINDVLINLVGASIGRVAVGGQEIEGANCNQAVCFVRLGERKILPGFLCGFLLTASGQEQIHGQKRDIARANLSLQDIRQIRIPKPSIDEQREIVTILQSIDHKIDLHRRKLRLLEELFHSLLQKLMTGEIRVDQIDLSALSSAAFKEAVA